MGSDALQPMGVLRLFAAPLTIHGLSRDPLAYSILFLSFEINAQKEKTFSNDGTDRKREREKERKREREKEKIEGN
jgi:hypothetical protein